MRILSVALLGALLTACGSDEAPQASAGAAAPAPSAQTALGRTVETAMQEAKRELATGNISLTDGIRIGDRNTPAVQGDLPRAEITPSGDLLIAGTPVALDARQRALLLEYRRHTIAIAEAGMDMGVKGADLGMQAAGDALRSVFTGDTANVEKRVEAEAAKLETAALALCAHLAPLLRVQQQLAATLPQFAPYATMEQADVDECLQRGDARNEIRDRVREGVRETVREVVRPGEAPTP